MVLLHSSTRTSYSGRYSLLACDLREQLCFDDFSALAGRLSADHAPFDNAWFGYFGYELKHALEHYERQTPNWHALPTACFMQFATIFQFDHEQQTLTAYSQSPVTLPKLSPTPAIYPPRVSKLSSNMSKQQYLHKAAHIIDATHQGELYQANLTRKFLGVWESAPDMLGLFARLCQQSPAPYSAYIRLNDTHILSSSPELFLRLDATGRIETRPIKGTAARGQSPAEDAALREALGNDAKNRAENLMIVDLMRNDLARASAPGSVAVDQLFEVSTHATIHHMASTIHAQKSAETSTLDAIKACFPPGSMTGAPKIRAITLCGALEEAERGVYSGAIGWLGGDGSAELSVVIRTLIAKGNRFEFQVGGGIVADSTPEEEWKETIDKSMGLLNTLNVKREMLEFL